MISSAENYTLETDAVNEESWYKILNAFEDANIYQTWAYEAIRYGEKNISHMVLKRNRQVVAAVQVRIMKLPLLNSGIAYVRWGPLWKCRNADYNTEYLQQIIISMREEYTEKRGLVLRIIPNETEQSDGQIISSIESTGLKWTGKDYRTMYIDLSHTTESIRSSMSKGWRKNLNKAERKELSIIEGTSLELFDVVARLFRETVARKGFEAGIDIDEYRAIQDSLPDEMKMQILVCMSGDETIAGLVGSSIGSAGIELIAATGDNGMKFGGSYLLRWRMLEYFKNIGCRFYNLNGINPARNPGGYQFKCGFAGKDGLDLYYIGNFQTQESKLVSLILKHKDKLSLWVKKYKNT